MSKEMQLPDIQTRISRVEEVIKQRELLPSKIIAGSGPFRIGGNDHVQEGTSIDADIQIGEKRDNVIAQVTLFTNDTLKNRLIQLRSTEEAVTMKKAQTYLDELNVRRVQLEQIKKFVQQGDLSPATLTRREQEYKEIKALSRADSRIQRGIDLLQQKAHPISREAASPKKVSKPDRKPTPNVKVSNEVIRQPMTSTETVLHPTQREKEKKPTPPLTKLTLPNQQVIEIRPSLSSKCIEIMATTSEAGGEITIDYLAQELYGKVDEESKHRTRAVLIQARELLKGMYTIPLLTTITDIKRGQPATYKLEEIHKQDIATEETAAPVEVAHVVKQTPSTESGNVRIDKDKPLRANYTPRVIEIPYVPSKEEMRTDEQMAALETTIAMLSRHTRIWPKKIESAVNSILSQKNGENFRLITYQSSQDLASQVSSAFRKMEKEARSPLLIAQWSETDLILWESITGTRAINEIISRLDSTHSTRILWEKLGGNLNPASNTIAGLMSRMEAPTPQKFLSKVEKKIQEGFEE